MLNYSTNQYKSIEYFNIINDFRNLIDFINYKDIFLEKMFHIIKNYFNFDLCGIFFNSPDDLEINTLEVYTYKNYSNFKNIESLFFNEIGKYKDIIKCTNNVHYLNKKPQIIKEIKYKEELILPFLYNGKLLGGICFFSNKYVLKHNIEIFNFIINEFLSIYKLKYMYSEQIVKSTIDSLTGLYNRNQFDIGINQEFNRSKRYETPFSIAMIDIDYFKNINDTMGHQFGDYVLIELSKIIQSTFRKTDIVYRYGGEEIVILMPETNSQKAYLPLEKLRKKIETYSFKNTKVTISIGISEFKEEFNSAPEILKKADENLYLAKNNGRNNIVF